MPVYIDDMHETDLGMFRGMRMSHMIADTVEELHAMADALGIERRHFQGDHYDVAKSKRRKALKYHGARAISMRECAAMCGLRKMGREMGDPRTAPDRYKAARAETKEGSQ